MIELEVTDILSIAEEFWPKSSATELGLLRKIIKSLPLHDAKNILEDVRLSTKFQTLPLPQINRKIKSFKPKTMGHEIPCWGLDLDTGKVQQCIVVAQSDTGAKEQFAKYLIQYNLDPTNFVIYVGEESFEQFFEDRHEVQCRLSPKVRETTEVIRKAVEAGKSVTELIMETKDVRARGFVRDVMGRCVLCNELTLKTELEDNRGICRECSQERKDNDNRD
jgi:hypothetical protein